MTDFINLISDILIVFLLSLLVKKCRVLKTEVEELKSNVNNPANAFEEMGKCMREMNEKKKRRSK